MFFNLIICAFIGSVLTEEWSCTTPDGEKGECVTLLDCPPLLDAFANPKKSMEDYLKKFVCVSTEPIVVCCTLSLNVTLSNVLAEPVQNITELSDLKYCGRQHADDYVRMETGLTLDEFPWLSGIVGFHLIHKYYDLHIGTLINSRYVLTYPTMSTIAHAQDNKLVSVKVRLGEYDILKTVDCVKLPQFEKECNAFQEYDVEKTIIHPFASQKIPFNFLALLRLSAEVIYTDYVRPICLPIIENRMPKVGDTLYTTGWGAKDSSGDITLVKKKVMAKFISNEDCRKAWQGSNNSPITSYQMCTIDLSNNTAFTCRDDKGSPAMYSRNSQWYLEGVVSWGNAICEKGLPVVEIKVSKYLSWIRENLEL